MACFVKSHFKINRWVHAYCPYYFRYKNNQRSTKIQCRKIKQLITTVYDCTYYCSIEKKVFGASLVSQSSTRPPLNDGGRSASKTSTQPKHLVSTLASNPQVALVLSANNFYTRISQPLSRFQQSRKTRACHQ